MKAITNKMSLLLAGFLSGMNLFPFSSSTQRISQLTGSLQLRKEARCEDGFEADAEKLKGDWSMVGQDVRNAYNKITNEQATEEQSNTQ